LEQDWRHDPRAARRTRREMNRGRFSTAVVIVNWNGHRDTVACLESLLRLETQDFHVILSDNGSAPGSVEHIVDWCEGRVEVATDDAAWRMIAAPRRRDPTWVYSDDTRVTEAPPFLTILRNRENLGFAGANNRGITLALADPATRFIWLLNNDTIVAPDCLGHLVARMQRQPDLGILGATIAYYDDPLRIQGLGARFNSLLGRGEHIGMLSSAHDLPPKSTVEAAMSYVMGASMFVSRRFIETVGPMNEEYFLYMEEFDWSTRNKGRFGLGWEPAARLYHKEGSTIGSSQRHRPSDTSLYFQSINLLRFNARYHPLYLPLNFVRILALAARFWLRKDRSGVSIMFATLRDFFFQTRRRGPIVPDGFGQVRLREE
jgi:GT2 family glycosyltransferase